MVLYMKLPASGGEKMQRFELWVNYIPDPMTNLFLKNHFLKIEKNHSQIWDFSEISGNSKNSTVLCILHPAFSNGNITKNNRSKVSKPENWYYFNTVAGLEITQIFMVLYALVCVCCSERFYSINHYHNQDTELF